MIRSDARTIVRCFGKDVYDLALGPMLYEVQKILTSTYDDYMGADCRSYEVQN